MKKLAAILLLVLSFQLSADAIHSAIQIAAKAGMGYLGGRRLNNDGPEARVTVGLKRLFSKEENEKAKQKPGFQGMEQCSGTVVEGCVVFARHCAGDLPVSMFHAEELDGAKADAIQTDIRTLGPGLREDLAVMKVEPAPDSDHSLTIDDLATERLKPGTLVNGAGYGFRATKIKEIQVGSQRAEGREDVESGVRRGGQMRVLSYSSFMHPKDDPAQGRTKAGNMVWVERSPNMVAHGDSGGGLWRMIGNKLVLHGVAISATFDSGDFLDRFSGYSEEPLLGYKSEDAVHGVFMSVADHRDWIVKSLKEMGCAPTVPPTKDLQKFLVKEFSSPSAAKQEWRNSKKWFPVNSEASAEERAESKLEQFRQRVYAILQKEGKIGKDIPHITIYIDDADHSDGKFHIRWTGKFGKTNEEDAAELERRGDVKRPSGTLVIDGSPPLSR